MSKARPLSSRSSTSSTFDLERYLGETRHAVAQTKYRKGSVIFAQGDPASDVRYLQRGSVKISVLSSGGREAVVALLGPGEFFGEGALAGQPSRMANATALAPSTVLTLDTSLLVRLLHEQPSFADRFLEHMLQRNIRVEADLVDQLFNSSEKRLARTLLLLARYGQDRPEQVMPRISQETLAQMIGSTRSRVNFFMNKFRRMGLIEYNGGITVRPALLTVVLHQ